VDNFNDKTTDGQNEDELINKFNTMVENEKQNELAKCVLTKFESYCMYGGAVVAAVGLGMFITGASFLGIIAIVAGLLLVVYHFSSKKTMEENREKIEKTYTEKREKGDQIIRATLAEVVDYRIEFAQKDGESQQVVDFLEQITPEQYVRKLASTNRRIKM
jgi:uncharacterized membrane protein YhiD involved in acid resistance